MRTAKSVRGNTHGAKQLLIRLHQILLLLFGNIRIEKHMLRMSGPCLAQPLRDIIDRPAQVGIDVLDSVIGIIY